MRRILPLFVLCAALSGVVSCRIIAGLLMLLQPEQRQDALFELGEGPVAIIIESNGEPTGFTEFRRALHVSTEKLLHDNDVKCEIVPFEKVLRLPEKHSDYHKWSVQRIGKELGADQVVFIYVDSFAVREAPGHPMLMPSVDMRVKVIDANAPPEESRLWPSNELGHAIQVSRQPKQFDRADRLADESRKLGVDAAQHVARLFYEYSLEETIPREN